MLLVFGGGTGSYTVMAFWPGGHAIFETALIFIWS